MYEEKVKLRDLFRTEHFVETLFHVLNGRENIFMAEVHGIIKSSMKLPEKRA